MKTNDTMMTMFGSTRLTPNLDAPLAAVALTIAFALLFALATYQRFIGF